MPIENKPKILMELRPALEGFAGIPQETRLLFSSFRDFDGFETMGLLNQYSKKLSHGLKKKKKYTDNNIHKKINLISRHIISHKEDVRRKGWYSFLSKKYKQEKDYYSLKRSAMLGLPHDISYLDTDGFEDFFWSTLFSKSLPFSEFEKIANSKFAVSDTPWVHMHRCGIKHSILGKQHSYPKLNTKDFDFFIGQTPFPAKLHNNTQMIIRYHDAIPVFLPHTIPNTKFHQRSHLMALKANVRDGAKFVCTSKAVREDLMRMFPKAEEQSTVIHDIVSDGYYEEKTTKQRLCNIIKSRLEKSTEPNFLNNQEKIRFYERNVNKDNFDYLIMVSTIEPRKNHMKLIGAWEMLREKLNKDLKLIIVGKPGWDNDKILGAMKPWQEKGKLFNLSAVPSADLRVLYNGAEAVVCPSIAEGFDLSGIEAMLSGAPVAASDINVHKEVYGDASEYFSPYSAKQAADAIERIIHPKQKGRRKELIELGLKHSEQYRKEAIAPKWEQYFEENRKKN